MTDGNNNDNNYIKIPRSMVRWVGMGGSVMSPWFLSGVLGAVNLERGRFIDVWFGIASIAVLLVGVALTVIFIAKVMDALERTRYAR